MGMERLMRCIVPFVKKDAQSQLLLLRSALEGRTR